MANERYTSSPTSSGKDGGIAIVPAASDLSRNARALYVGTNGDITFRYVDGDDTDITWTNVKAGSILPIQVKRVSAATATVFPIYE